MRSLVHLNSVTQLNNLDHGPWPYRRMAGLKAWLLLNPVAGSRRVGSPMTALTHHRQGAPAGHHRKCITQQWIGLTLLLAVESFVSIRIGG
jgi:hypothetical protein